MVSSSSSTTTVGERVSWFQNPAIVSGFATTTLTLFALQFEVVVREAIRQHRCSYHWLTRLRPWGGQLRSTAVVRNSSSKVDGKPAFGKKEAITRLLSKVNMYDALQHYAHAEDGRNGSCAALRGGPGENERPGGKVLETQQRSFDTL